MKMTQTNTTQKYIDVTPTWESLALNIAHLAILGETFDSLKIGKDELLRMAKLADLQVEHQKEIARKEAQGLTEGSFTRLPSDSNGNPRYYLPKYLAPELIVRQLGGVIYRGKQYGAGWVFQTYSLRSECDAINKFNDATK